MPWLLAALLGWLAVGAEVRGLFQAGWIGQSAHTGRGCQEEGTRGRARAV
jgi:hypothetical protein